MKYGGRVLPDAAVIAGAVVYAVVFIGAILATRRLNQPRPVALRWAAFGIVLVAVLLALLSPEANRVARLPALAVWLDRLAAGTFPYASPIRPSGFPGLYALALPFWATATQ